MARASLYMPTAQTAHAVAPVAAPKVPAAQDVQTPAAAAEYAPAAQKAHLVERVAPLAAENFPAGQSKHDEACFEAWKVPAAHKVHWLAPNTL